MTMNHHEGGGALAYCAEKERRKTCLNGGRALVKGRRVIFSASKVTGRKVLGVPRDGLNRDEASRTKGPHTAD